MSYIADTLLTSQEGQPYLAVKDKMADPKWFPLFDGSEMLRLS